MARIKPSDFIKKAPVPIEKRPDPAEKQELKNGKVYVLGANYSVKGKIAILPPGTEFRECRDGYFSVYIGGSRMGFRVGDKVMEEVKEYLTHKEPIIV